MFLCLDALLLCASATPIGTSDRPNPRSVQLGHNGDLSKDLPSSVQLHIGERPMRTVRTDRNTATSAVPAARTSELLARILKDTAITWSAGLETSKLSSKAANALLLKKEEFQGDWERRVRCRAIA